MVSSTSCLYCVFSTLARLRLGVPTSPEKSYHCVPSCIPSTVVQFGISELMFIILFFRIHRELDALRRLWLDCQRQLKKRMIFGTIEVIQSWDMAQVSSKVVCLFKSGVVAICRFCLDWVIL